MRPLARYGVPVLAIGAIATWLSAASWLFVRLGALGAYYPNAWLGIAWPRYVAGWAGNTIWTNVLLIIAALPMTALYALTGAAAWRPIARRARLRWRSKVAAGSLEPAPTINHGQAQWETLANMRRRFRADLDYGGVPVGEALLVHESALAGTPFDEDNPHTWGTGGKAPLLIDSLGKGAGPYAIVIGSSGGYKTQAASIPALFTWLSSAVVIDPKCKLAAKYGHVREAMGQRVVVLKPGQPGPNVLDWIDPADELAETHIRSVVADICQEDKAARQSETSALFSDLAKNLIGCILAHLIWDNMPDRTLYGMRKIVCLPGGQLRKRLEEIHRHSSSELARDLAGSILMSPDAAETWDSIRITAVRYTEWLSTKALADMVSGGGFSAEDIAKKLVTVFIEMPLLGMLSTPQPVRVLFGALLGAMYRHGSLTNRCLFIADEAKTLGKSVQMEMARDAGREAGINMLLAFQSVHQVREVWEKGAGSWFASASWVSFSCIAEIETAELVAKLCGKRGVLAYSEGLNSGTSSGQNRSRSSGYQTNAHEISRDLIQPAEVIHKLRTDEQIVIAPGCNPMRMSRSIAFRRPEMDTKIKETP